MEGLLINGEIKKVWKETAFSLFEVILGICLKRAEENHAKPRSR
jgi:hypothetical protein